MTTLRYTKKQSDNFFCGTLEQCLKEGEKQGKAGFETCILETEIKVEIKDKIVSTNISKNIENTRQNLFQRNKRTFRKA